MTRWLVVFLVLAGFLTLVRELVLMLGEIRRRRAARLSDQLDGRDLEHDIAQWRHATGRRLWIQLVGVPLLLIGILILVGVYG
ncbi:hypothetical protein [Salinarimonas ramus]|uniref:Uncharacterized protein n=1 Tax=Salinarimonas ramus TaxID=690164 RepID=A0A917Q4C5_9HYPH|nr:hypothetical protein [Salinarimonas ramus]GGK19939.1 hypothetical protein GCM10011322_03260 [Salinarimonas ramus]